MKRALLLLVPWLLAAGPTPAELLKSVDAAAERVQDLEMTLVVHREGQRRELKIWQRGDKRLVKLLTPPRLRGVGLLSLGEDSLQLFLPAYGRVRRVSGESRGDSFMGTGLSMEDLSRVRFGRDYDAAPLPAGFVEDAPEAQSHRGLLLTPKDPDAFRHAKVYIYVHLESSLVTHADFIGKDGSRLRRLRVSDIKKVGAHFIGHALEVRREGESMPTTAKVEAIALDAGVPEKVFTRGYLQRRP